ncbi:MAG: hypothetical protein ACI8PT_001685 [Gammaproteobacteria bacterium]|jgi:hypothetical protein
MRDINELPIESLDRICHYLINESASSSTEVGDPYGRERAEELLGAGLAD